MHVAFGLYRPYSLIRQTAFVSTTCRYISNDKQQDKKLLVILLPWMRASRTSISKYQTLYEKLGFEVVTRQVNMVEFLWPKQGLKHSSKFLESLQRKVVEDKQPIVIHAMSAGGFFYALMLLRFQTDRSFDNVLASIKCQVFDSPVVGTLAEMGTAVALMATQNRLLQLTLKNLTLFYFALTKQHTVKLYDKSISMYKTNPPKVPTLLMSSKNDPMALPDALQGFASAFRDCGLDVTVHLWKDSKHTQHYRYHPESYEKKIKDVLQKAKIL